MEPGDVILVLQQKDHESFTRDGNDLYVSKTVGLTEALCGFEMVLKHLDQRDLVLRYPAGNIIEPGKNNIILTGSFIGMCDWCILQCKKDQKTKNFFLIECCSTRKKIFSFILHSAVIH